MPSPPSYGCCTRVNFVLKKHLLFQMNLSNSGLKNRSIKEYWLIFTILKFPLGLQFSHNLTKFKIIKYISTIYIMTTTCTYLQQLTQVSDVAHGPLVLLLIFHWSFRSLDLSLDNEIERIHAQKLIRRIAKVVSQKMPKSLVFPVVAIGCDGAEERDRMVRISLATICEMCKLRYAFISDE